MKRFFIFLLILGLFVSVPVFADDYTLQDLGLYDSTVDLPTIPDAPDGYPYYAVYYGLRDLDTATWWTIFFDRVDGCYFNNVDFDSSVNDSFSIFRDYSTGASYFKVYRLVDGDWVFYQQGKLYSQLINGSALNFTNFDIVGGDHTVIANPMMGGVPMILRSHLPRLPQTITMVGSVVLSKALLILAILLAIGLVPRLIRSWAH